MKMVEWEDLEIGVFNCNGEIYAIEDRCSHDNGTLVEGTLDQENCTSSAPGMGPSSTCARASRHPSGVRARRDVSGAHRGGPDQGGGGIDGDS
jgi:hypothetical protein